MIRQILVVAFILAGAQAIFFGGSSCCQPSCCTPAPQPCQCPPAPVCQPSYQPAPQAYVQPIAPPCRPRYIIVRQVEQQIGAPSYVSSPIQAPVAPIPSYQPVQSYASAPVAPVPSYQPAQKYASAPAQSYASGPVHSAPISTGAVEQPIETAPVATPMDAAQQPGYRAFASKTVADPRCNSVELRAILQNEISGDANESKRRVHKAANEQFQTADSERGIDVICANGSFSYRIATDIFCEHTKDDITCFAYQQHS
uniref:Ground-like domain-containing protein n=1 Tax=Panagrolaimus sp. JU765 TaxID=591449 RepID=A0AC34QS93_9BILA